MIYICTKCGTSYEMELGGCPKCRMQIQASSAEKEVCKKKAEEFWRDNQYSQEKQSSDR